MKFGSIDAQWSKLVAKNENWEALSQKYLTEIS